jgi:hypothetical protein
LEGKIVPGHDAEGVVVGVQIARVTDDGLGGLGQGGHTLNPTVIDLLTVAVTKFPIAIDANPDAVLLGPITVAKSADAVLENPKMAESSPEAVELRPATKD